MSDTTSQAFPEALSVEGLRWLDAFSMEYKAEVGEVHAKVLRGFDECQPNLDIPGLSYLRREVNWGMSSTEFWFPRYGLLTQRAADMRLPLDAIDDDLELRLETRVARQVLYSKHDVRHDPPAILFGTSSLVIGGRGQDMDVVQAPIDPNMQDPSAPDSFFRMHKDLADMLGVSALDLLARIHRLGDDAASPEFWAPARIINLQEFNAREAVNQVTY